MNETISNNLKILESMITWTVDKFRELVEDEPHNLLWVPIFGVLMGMEKVFGEILKDVTYMTLSWTRMTEDIQSLRSENSNLLTKNDQLRRENTRIRSHIGRNLPFPLETIDPAVKFLATFPGRKISAIKKAREIHELGLADAKNLVEAFYDSFESDAYRRETEQFYRRETEQLTGALVFGEDIEAVAEKWASIWRPVPESEEAPPSTN